MGTIQDLSLIPVTNLEEVLEIISLGLKLRATHETKMNQVTEECNSELASHVEV